MLVLPTLGLAYVLEPFVDPTYGHAHVANLVGEAAHFREQELFNVSQDQDSRKASSSKQPAMPLHSNPK